MLEILPLEYLHKLPYRGKLKKLRRKVKEIDGIPLVNIKWLREYLSEKEFAQYHTKYELYKVHEYCICSNPECRSKHMNKQKFKSYANFWQLEEFLNKRERSKI